MASKTFSALGLAWELVLVPRPAASMLSEEKKV
jgi:hypothetical protein